MTTVRKVHLLLLFLLAMTVVATAQERLILVGHYGSGNQDRGDVTSILQTMVHNGTLNFIVSSDVLGGDPSRGAAKDLEIVVRDQSGRISEYRFRDGESVNLQLRGYGSFGGGYPRNRMPLTEQAQRQFDEYYVRWLGYEEQRNRDAAEETAERMRDIMRAYNVPRDTPFATVATAGLGATRSGWNDLRIIRASYGTSTRTVDLTEKLQRMVRDNAINLHVTTDNLDTDPAPGQFKQLYVTYFHQGQERQVVVDDKGFLKIP